MNATSSINPFDARQVGFANLQAGVDGTAFDTYAANLQAGVTAKIALEHIATNLQVSTACFAANLFDGVTGVNPTSTAFNPSAANLHESATGVN